MGYKQDVIQSIHTGCSHSLYLQNLTSYLDKNNHKLSLTKISAAVALHIRAPTVVKTDTKIIQKYTQVITKKPTRWS